MCEGIADELQGIDLGDKRLNKRSKRVIEALAANPEASINASCEGWNETLAAYRFFDNCGGPGALDSFWVKLRCGVLTTLSGPRHPSQVSRGRKAASAFSLLLCSPASVGP